MPKTRAKPRYYVVRNGRGFWQPNGAMALRFGVKTVACGPDGPDAHRIAEECNAIFEQRRKGEARVKPKELEPNTVGNIVRLLARSRAWQRLSPRTRLDYDRYLVAMLGKEYRDLPPGELESVVQVVIPGNLPRSKRTRSGLLSLFGNPNPKPHTVYIVEAVGLALAKIGRTMDLEARLTAMRTDCPVPVRVLFQSADYTEANLHARFDRFRSHLEWFHLTPIIRDEIANLGSEVTQPALLPVRKK